MGRIKSKAASRKLIKHTKKLIKQQKKIKTVIHEYKVNKLYSSSGKLVKKRKQAVAISLSKARHLK